MFNKNFESHVEAIQTLSGAVKELQNEIRKVKKLKNQKICQKEEMEDDIRRSKKMGKTYSDNEYNSNVSVVNYLGNDLY